MRKIKTANAVFTDAQTQDIGGRVVRDGVEVGPDERWIVICGVDAFAGDLEFHPSRGWFATVDSVNGAPATTYSARGAEDYIAVRLAVSGHRRIGGRA